MVPVRTLSTASPISPCPAFESGTLSKASLPPPLLIGYLSNRHRLSFAPPVAGFRNRLDCLCPTNQNSEAVAKEIGAPASGITATRWQVLTPRTKISYPVLGLERIASPSLKLAQTCQHTQAKLIHLFTIIHNGASSSHCGPDGDARAPGLQEGGSVGGVGRVPYPGAHRSGHNENCCSRCQQFSFCGRCRINAASRQVWERRIYAAARRQSENCRAPKAKMRIAATVLYFLAAFCFYAYLWAGNGSGKVPYGGARSGSQSA